MPRPTWALLESGDANPTIATLTHAAEALQVTVQELIEPATAGLKLFLAAELKRRTRRQVEVQSMLPDSFIGTQIERMTFTEGSSMRGVPHREGTREYLLNDKGRIELRVAGESVILETGDVAVFHGDSKHSYVNLGAGVAVATSIIILDRGRVHASYE